MSFSAGSAFLVGINQPWFHGEYDRDLGYNQFSIERLYRPVVPSPALPDPNPPFPYVSSNPGTLQNFFQSAQTQQGNLRLVRVWAFERFEALKFDVNGSVIGIDTQHFLPNILRLLDAARNYNTRVYLCLNSWSIYDGPPQDLVNAGRTQDYLDLQNTWKRNSRLLLTDANALNAFVANALVPLLNAIGAHPALFAIDLMNEPDLVLEKDPSVKIGDIRNYVAACSSAIRGANPSILVSCGFMRRSFAKANSGLLAPHLDFFDFHEYNDAGALDPYRASDFAGKPCIIGECGYSLSRVPYDATREAAALQNFLRNAHELGYAGCLAWMFSDYQNGNSLSQVVANFADAAPAIRPEQKRTGSCFIATAALGSELHPHVQLLRDYRDGVLLQSRYRAAFERLLEFYYSFSPPIARAMKKSRALNVFLRYFLVYPIVFGIKGLLPLFDKGLRISKNRMND